MPYRFISLLERPVVALLATTLASATSIMATFFQRADPIIAGVTVAAAGTTAVCIALLHVRKVWRVFLADAMRIWRKHHWRRRRQRRLKPRIRSPTAPEPPA